MMLNISGGGYEVLKSFRYIPVPVFIVLSFYLCANQLNIAGIKKRIWRIGFPHLFWTCFSFLIYNLIGNISDNNQFKYTFVDLILNLLTGIGFNSVMWFQLILFILTLLFSLLNQHKELNDNILIVLTLFCIGFQYTGTNYVLFEGLSIRITNSYARMAEVIPFAAMGVMLKQSEMERDCKLKQMIPGLLILLLGSNFGGVRPQGFSFQGLNTLILATMLVIFFKEFTVFNKYDKLSLCINNISNYTMGVYFIHCMIRDLGQPLFLGMGMNGFTISCLIYMTSLLLAFLISKIPILHINELVC